MRRLLGHRDARLLLFGETLSMFGDRAMLLVLAIWAKTLTGSNVAAGFAIFAVVAPSIAAPLAGLVVDRVRRRPLMVATDLLTGAAVLSLIFVHDRHELWIIYAVGVLYGVSQLVFGSAQSALLTVLLPSNLLAAANSAFQTLREGLRILAPPVGAAIFAAIGGGAVAVFDAATFGSSALFLASLRTREPMPAVERRGWAAGLSGGIRHIWVTPALRQIVLGTAVSFLVIGFSETLAFALNDQGLHRPPAFIGVLGASQGVGAVLGGLVAAPVLRRIGDGRLVGLGFAALRSR
ncbi:MAG TPA: MFS transporter [Candidatus Dormibacteraeota bacterium]